MSDHHRISHHECDSHSRSCTKEPLQPVRRRARRRHRIVLSLALAVVVSLTALAAQRGLFSQARELALHLSAPELVVHELPRSMVACAVDPPTTKREHSALDAAAPRLLRGAEVEIAELRERAKRLEGELTQVRVVARQLRDQLARERHAQGRARSEGRSGGSSSARSPKSRAPADPQAEVERRLAKLGFAPVRPGPNRSSFASNFVAPTPKVQLLGSDAWITGNVTNRSGSVLQPLVVIDLLRSGRIEGSRELRLKVPPGSTVPYEARLPTGLAEGTYSARVRLEA